MAAYCADCGKMIPDTAKFCEHCGKAVIKKHGGNITLCEDGKYRWVYELDLFKTPTVFLLVWKILFFVILGIFAFTNIVDLIEWREAFLQSFLNNLKVFGIITLGMTVIVLISYLIYAAVMGGKYCVMFEMDEKGVNHRQLPKQAKKAQLISELTRTVGTAAGSPSTAAAGIGAERTEMYSQFSQVKKVISYPRRRLIKVNGVFQHNQVYAEQEDFDFVANYIKSRCPAAKKRGKQ